MLNRRIKKLQLLLVLILVLPGCQTIPKDALKFTPVSLEKRSLQTRKFEGILEGDILLASAAVMQDLGFNIDESETNLGVLVGSKNRSAYEAGQVAAAVAFALLGGGTLPIDSKQKLRLSLIVSPATKSNEKSHMVRVTFQRVVWDTQNNVSKIEGLDDPVMYQEFFDRLSQSVFLEGQKI